MKFKDFVKKNIIPITIIAIVLGAITVSVSIAYFTSEPGTLLNTFSTGNVKITVIEENFDDERALNVNPNQTISKDPYVKNTGGNPAYVFIQVEIPNREVILVKEDGITLEELNLVQMFTYEITSNWVLVDEKAAAEKNIYVYAYLGGILQPNDSSDRLFTEVNCVNFLEGSLDPNDTLNIVIKGLAVQSDNLNIEGTTDIEKMEFIYNTYIKK